MKSNLIRLAVGLVMAVVAAGGFFYAFSPGYVYSVMIDGEEVGYVADFAEYSTMLTEMLAEEEAVTDLELSFAQEIRAKRQFAWSPETDSDKVREALARQVSYTAVGWAIAINGEPLVFLESAETAQSVLDLVKENAVAQSDPRRVLAVEIIEDVSISQHTVLPEEVLSAEAAFAILAQGHERVETYTVARGDSLWSISRSLNVSQEELEAANPNLDPRSLQPGQQLNLVRAEPLVSVRVIKEVSIFESIPFTTQYRNTGSLWYYQSRTAQQGKSGQREIIYEVEYINGVEKGRKVIQSQVVSDPQPRIIERGTSRWPSAATGSFRWPINSGTITDRFGAYQSWRTQRHTGVDIGAPSGTPIYAAASGRVAQAGWAGSYGLMVLIDHGNGYSTLYAHASSLNVSAGQTVSKGQLIARVGSTGYSTGPHLHFEIRRNGTPIDPLRFYAP